MGIDKIIAKKKDAIVADWFEKVAKTYPPDAAQFIIKDKDPFSNPIGGNLSKGLAGIFDQLAAKPDRETVAKHLDPIIRIRAIQNFSPSQAVAFIPALKSIVHKYLKKELKNNITLQELLDFESKIDAISLLAFDLYMECREKLYELKNNLEQEKVFKAFKRAGLIVDNSDGPGT